MKKNTKKWTPPKRRWVYRNYTREDLAFYDWLARPRVYGSNEAQLLVFEPEEIEMWRKFLNDPTKLERVRFPHKREDSRYYPIKQ